MSFKPEIKEINLTRQVFSKTLTETVQGDIIVPDVKGDIAKILQTNARAQIDSKEINGGRVTVSGTVFTDVLYVPEGGGIDSLSTKMSFNTVAKVPEDNAVLSAVCRVDGAEHNIYNSRKINVKAILSVTATGTASKTAGILTGFEDDSPVELQKSSVSLSGTTAFASDVIPFRETLEIPSSLPPAGSVLKCSASLSDKDFRLLSNKAVIRGSLNVSVLYKGEEQGVFKAEFSNPITEIIDLPGASENMEEDISVSLTGFTASPTAGGDGDMRAFFTEGKILVDASCRKTEEYSVITDMFSTESSLEISRISIPVSGASETTLPIGVSHIIPSAESSLRQILDTSVRPKITKCETMGGELFIQGDADAEILGISDDSSYICVKKTVPFSYSGAWTESTPLCTPEARGISATLSSAGDIDLSFTVTVNARSTGGTEISCIQSAAPESSVSAKERPSLIVYFSREGDSLWSIAKRYAVKCENIIKANKLSGEIAPGQRIIIPR